MLVLSRKVGESIQINDNVSVTIVEIKGGRIRLAIDAPRSVSIVRKELLERDRAPDVSPVLVVDLPREIEECFN